jgi:hypothetical protein
MTTFFEIFIRLHATTPPMRTEVHSFSSGFTFQPIETLGEMGRLDECREVTVTVARGEGKTKFAIYRNTFENVWMNSNGEQGGGIRIDVRCFG